MGDSVADVLESMGLETVGTHGTTAALAMLNDAVKKGGVMASSRVGGLSGAFIPVSEDIGMIEAAERGAITFDKLEAMTCVCSVGLDMIAIPGDTPASTIAAILADDGGAHHPRTREKGGRHGEFRRTSRKSARHARPYGFGGEIHLPRRHFARTHS